MRVVGVNGSDLKSHGPASFPAWSPDGSRRAFAKVALDEGHKGPYMEGLYTVSLGDSNPREIVSLYGELRWNRTVSWSPDGFEILVGPFVVSVDGSAIRLLPHPDRATLRDLEPKPDHYSQTSWSPDGSSIVIQTTEDGTNGSSYHTELYTVSRDGSDSRVLVVSDSDGNLSAGGGGPLRVHPVEREYYGQGERNEPEKRP